VLKQPQYQPLPVEKQVIIIYAAINGFLDDVAVEDLRRYETDLLGFLDTRRGQLLSALAEKKQIDDPIKADLTQALTEFGQAFVGGQKTTAA
jgi:F-type H+-transporting ATPase subunit alpha